MDEKQILDDFTQYCLDRADRAKELRIKCERRAFADRYPESNHWDRDYKYDKVLENMLKLYMLKEKELEELKVKWNNP